MGSFPPVSFVFLTCLFFFLLLACLLAEAQGLHMYLQLLVYVALLARGSR